MGKPTGFLDYRRKLPEDREPEERIKDWNEFHTHFNVKSLRTQGARCMDCGVPFCHAGMAIGRTSIGCPLNNLIPEWNDLVYNGNMEEAYRRLSLTSNFPEFTGRVCPALCEGSCTAGMNGDPVTVKNIECHIIDNAWEQGYVKPRIPKTRRGKTVAVVGSGPSGLACADMLNQKGYSVTVFEKSDRPGGLLMYGIPNMKLDKKIVERRVKLMEEEGITFKCGVEIGKDYAADKLDDDFDAVVLCIGAGNPRPLKAEGANLNGIYYAVDFLAANTKSLLDSDLTDGMNISAKDKNVIVVGGGDTGTDCVGTCIRHGCKSVTQLEIMSEASEGRRPDNPWPEWPRVKKTDYGQEEAIYLYGKDPREYLTTITKIDGNEYGNVQTVHTVSVEWVTTPSGALAPRPIKGTEKERPCDMVLIAMGFLGPVQTIAGQLGMETDMRSNYKAHEKNHKTSVRGIFAAGDCRRGQSLVVWAIREGREAAEAVDKYLSK